MRQLTSQELKEPNSTLIIPARIWDALPREVTDVMYGYIGRLGRIGNTPAYRFDNVPQYKAREFEAACKSWSCPECGDTNQANRRYDSTGLAVCDNCKSAFEPGLIGEWIK